jgi:glyoxylase-like metal-dependent hydrolase (beta-lactamase superfamily II)
VAESVRMDQLRPGLYTWTAPHPDWTPEQGGPEGWDREVRSYAHDGGDTLVLIDPQSVPSRADELAAGKQVVVLLTCGWHARSARGLVDRLGATIRSPESDEEAPGAPFRPGDALPGGVEAKGALYPGEAVLWIPEHGALVAGDLLIHRADGLEAPPDSWLPDGVTREQLAESLRPLLELPVELVLPTHGDPITNGAREALERAIAG